MKLFKLCFLFGVIASLQSCNNDDPYAIGLHWDYSVMCENGFIYKSLGQRRGTIQVFNSDGTPLQCGKQIY